jgi:transposase-like protein
VSLVNGYCPCCGSGDVWKLAPPISGLGPEAQRYRCGECEGRWMGRRARDERTPVDDCKEPASAGG